MALRTGGASVPAAGGGDIRVLVVDDSAVVRGLTRRWIDAEPDMTVAAAASDGLHAVAVARDCRPDVVVLDINMPRMDGLTALPRLLEIDPRMTVVMSSTLTTRNAEISLQAMALGAADYVAKPEAASERNAAEVFRRELLGKIRALAARRSRPDGAAGEPRPAPACVPRAAPAGVVGRSAEAGAVPLRKAPLLRPQAIGIGSSTGGPKALQTLLRSAGGAAATPVLITQHMPPTFTTILAQHIDLLPGISCSEAEDGMPVEPGRVYLAPGDRHMLVRRSGGACRIALSDAPPENFCRPAVDPMFRSLAEAYDGKVLAVVLTGMGADGLAGARSIVDRGGVLVAQDEASSVVWGMPGAVATAGLCSAVLPLDEIGPALNRVLGGGAL